MEWPKKTYSPEAYENKEREEFREKNFPRVIAQHLIEHVTDDFAEAGFEEEEIKEVEHAMYELGEEQLRAVLSVPAQLRVRLYSRYLERMRAGELTPEGIVADLRAKNEQNRYTLGYHLSPREIKPDAEGNWVIKGTEPDHRNEDIPMAYYSLDYRNRYREKPSKYLYVVRAELQDQSGHYRDNNGVWGRAPSLSVVDSFNLPEIEAEMDRLMKQTEENEKGETPEHLPYERHAA